MSNVTVSVELTPEQVEWIREFPTFRCGARLRELMEDIKTNLPSLGPRYGVYMCTCYNQPRILLHSQNGWMAMDPEDGEETMSTASWEAVQATYDNIVQIA